MAKKLLWYRLGDNDDYHITELSEMIELLRELDIGKVKRCRAYGITDELFSVGDYPAKFGGNNYISLFYGDKDAQPIETISEQELQVINKELKN